MKLGVQTNRFNEFISQLKQNNRRLKLGFGIFIIFAIWAMYLTGNIYIAKTVSLTSTTLSVFSHLNLTHLIANTIGILICIVASLTTQKRFAVPFFVFAVLGHIYGLTILIEGNRGIVGISGGTYGYISYVNPKIGIAAIAVSLLRYIFIPWGTVIHEVHIGVSLLGLAVYFFMENYTILTYDEYSYQTQHLK